MAKGRIIMRQVRVVMVEHGVVWRKRQGGTAMACQIMNEGGGSCR